MLLTLNQIDQVSIEPCSEFPPVGKLWNHGENRSRSSSLVSNTYSLMQQKLRSLLPSILHNDESGDSYLNLYAFQAH